MTIGGNVQDTASKIPLKNAVAMVMRIKDSVLIAFTHTDEKGFFVLKNIPIDTLQVIISHLSLASNHFMFSGVLLIILSISEK